MCSDRKTEANRRNAQKSTGPKTEAGKASSARNAATHHLFCQDLLLPAENEQAFHLLRTEILRKLDPRDTGRPISSERVVRAIDASTVYPPGAILPAARKPGQFQLLSNFR